MKNDTWDAVNAIAIIVSLLIFFIIMFLLFGA
jgi:hypothetical protein